jgi:hypothetical protein
MMTDDGWQATHRKLFSVLPDALLTRTDWGITQTWCSLVRTISARPACALLHEAVAHLDEHMIERAGLDNLSYSRKNESEWQVIVSQRLVLV